MDGFEVTVEALHGAAGAVGTVAGDAAAVPLADAAGAVGDALPDGAAGAAAAALAEVWRERVAAAADALARHAHALQEAGDAYGSAERAAVAALAGER